MTQPPFGHAALCSRYRFEGTLELATPLRLSSGRASVETDAPIMRDRDLIPYIPGSSLRGSLRSELERVLAAAGSRPDLWACTLFVTDDAADACLTASPAKQERLRKLDEKARARTATSADRQAPLDLLAKDLCPLCQLFGSPFYASRLVIEDAYPKSRSELRDRSVVRDGVGIDRDTGAAREQVKFDYEVLETGKDRTPFTLSLQVENLTPADAEILGLAFGLLAGGLHVGGKRAAGLGCIKLKMDSLAAKGFASPEAMWKAVRAGHDPHQAIPIKEVLRAQAPAL